MADNIVNDVIDSSNKSEKLLKFQVDTDKGTCVVTGWNDLPDNRLNILVDTIRNEYGGKYTLNIDHSIKYNRSDYTVVGIASGAFSANSSTNSSAIALNTGFLTEVILPSTIEYIGDEAFRGNSLSRINFDENLTLIGNGAFGGCTNLGAADEGELNIPATTELRTNVFSGCTSLIRVNVGDIHSSNPDISGYILNELPTGTFNGCTNLIACTFLVKGSKASIGDSAFYGCTNLRYVELPLAWFVSIGDSAFEGCTKFEALWDQGPVYNPNANPSLIYCMSPISIGSKAFKNCNSLMSLPFSSRICKMGESAFELCWSLEHFNFAGSTTVSSEEGDGTLLTEIPKSAFQGCASLSQIYIPASCVSIGEHAFSGCSRLRDVFIPSATFSKFGDNSFFNCISLKRVWLLSNSINNIIPGNNTFLRTPEHKQLILNSEVIDNGQVGDYDDWEGSFGTSWEVSSEKSTIIYKPAPNINPEQHEFIVELVRSNNAGTTLGYAKIVGLLNQNSMTSGIVHIPETVSYNNTNYNVTAIGDKAFVNNFRLAEVDIPTTLKTIGRCAFLNCYNLRKISGTSVNVFPIENIEPYAFAHCRNLNRINNDQNALTNLKSIGEGVFIGCESLGKINVTSLGSTGGTPVLPARTFAHCGVLTITKTTGTSIFEDTEIVNYDRSTFYGTEVTVIQ